MLTGLRQSQALSSDLPTAGSTVLLRLPQRLSQATLRCGTCQDCESRISAFSVTLLWRVLLCYTFAASSSLQSVRQAYLTLVSALLSGRSVREARSLAHRSLSHAEHRLAALHLDGRLVITNRPPSNSHRSIETFGPQQGALGSSKRSCDTLDHNLRRCIPSSPLCHSTLEPCQVVLCTFFFNKDIGLCIKKSDLTKHEHMCARCAESRCLAKVGSTAPAWTLIDHLFPK